MGNKTLQTSPFANTQSVQTTQYSGASGLNRGGAKTHGMIHGRARAAREQIEILRRLHLVWFMLSHTLRARKLVHMATTHDRLALEPRRKGTSKYS
eukprot:6472232-Amphidinium_carterae.1